MADFEIDGVRYRSRRMAAMTQFDLLQALSPMIGSLSDLFGNKEAQGAEVIRPIANALATMPREQTHYVIEECMRTVERDRGKGDGWARVWNESIHQPQFEDIDLMVMSQIVMNVLQEAFMPFWHGARFNS